MQGTLALRWEISERSWPCVFKGYSVVKQLIWGKNRVSALINKVLWLYHAIEGLQKGTMVKVCYLDI